MNNKNIVGIDSYANLLLQISNLLNCSFQEIKNKYADYPHCETNYFEKGLKDRFIEIRFDEKEITVTCTFNSDEICDCIHLFPDKKETNNELIAYLGEVYKYDFIDTMWFTSNHHIKIEKTTPSLNDICFMINAKG